VLVPGWKLSCAHRVARQVAAGRIGAGMHLKRPLRKGGASIITFQLAYSILTISLQAVRIINI